ncbi:MAG: hypothetical protein ACREM3_11820 [Candidatus Rokuibacteriota bacterium]
MTRADGVREAMVPEALRADLGMLAGHVLLLDHGGFFAGVLGRLRARLAELGPADTWTRTATSTGISSWTGNLATW